MTVQVRPAGLVNQIKLYGDLRGCRDFITVENDAPGEAVPNSCFRYRLR